MTPTRPPCCVPGCKEQRGRRHQWCEAHGLQAFPCRIEGCQNRVASWNKSRCCEDHREFRHIYRGFNP